MEKGRIIFLNGVIDGILVEREEKKPTALSAKRHVTVFPFTDRRNTI